MYLFNVVRDEHKTFVNKYPSAKFLVNLNETVKLTNIYLHS